MTEIVTSPLSMTSNAVAEVVHLYSSLNVPSNCYLRIGVKGGDCAGFSYILGFDEKKEQDNIYELDGVKIIIDKAQEMYLQGTELDFKAGLDNRGFIFNNPNAEETCGCGSSFKA